MVGMSKSLQKLFKRFGAAGTTLGWKAKAYAQIQKTAFVGVQGTRPFCQSAFRASKSASQIGLGYALRLAFRDAPASEM
jgi:hypothetical protein